MDAAQQHTTAKSFATECPDENLFVSILQGDLGGEARQTLDDHIDQCISCAELFSELAFLVSSHSTSSTLPAMVPKSLDAFEEPTQSARPQTTSQQRIAGRYEILRQVGAGGMGTVYEAYDDALKRKVAIKLLRPDLLDPAIREACSARLLREARLLAAIYHPHVLNVYDVGVWNEAIFIAIQFIEGETLKSWLKTHNAPWREVLQIFLNVGSGLVEAHKQGLIHRDIKPENILIDPQGCAWLADFGLARAIGSDVLFTASEDGGEACDKASPTTPLDLSTVTRTGAVMGTPAYMAPEQHLGQPTDERTDQFSFAISVFEAIYGERPFRGSSRQDLQDAVCRHAIQPLPKTPYPPALYRVLKKAMSARPADRYAMMVLFLEDLERAASSVPVWRRGAVFWLSLALVSMSGVAIAGWYNVSQTDQTPAVAATTSTETSTGASDNLDDINFDDLNLDDLDLPEAPKKLTAKEKKKMRAEAFAELHQDCLAEKDATAFSCRMLSTWLSTAVIDLEYEGIGMLGEDLFKASVLGLEERFAELCNAPEPLLGSCAVAAMAYSYSKHDSETPEGSMIPKYDAFMRRGCEHGESMACMYMRNTYAAGGLDHKSYGSFALPVSEKTFLASVGKSCEAGDGMACWWVGEVYWGSDYLKAKKKYRKAVKYFEKSCERGFNQGCLFAGLVRQPYTLKECQKLMQDIHKTISDNSVFDNTATWSDIEGFCGHVDKLRGKNADIAQEHWLRGCMHRHQEPNAFYDTMQHNAQVLSCVLGEVSPYFVGEER